MKQFYTLYLIVGISLLSITGLSQSYTMYYMGNVPQSYYLNPATQPKCGLFLGSLLFPTYVSIANTGFSPSDIMWYDSEIDSVIQPFHPKAGVEKLLDKMNTYENISTELNQGILSFGFRAGEMYFCFDASLHVTQRFVYPKSLLKFVLSGNEDNETFDFSDMNYEALAYAELGFNISRNFGDMLTVGIRPKILYGLGTFSTQNNHTTLTTNYDQWNINADIDARIALTGIPIPVDEDGNLDLGGEYNFDSIYSSPSAIMDAIGANKGMAIDLGVHFKPVDQIQFSLSILDLGRINWKENTHVSSFKGQYTYKGLPWLLSESDTGSWSKDLLDTLREGLNLVNSNKAFKTSLHTKIYAGGRIFLTPGFDVGLLSRTEFLPEMVDQDFILVTDLRAGDILALSASYSLLGKGHTSLGLGIGLKLGPANTYLVFDNVPLVYDKLKSKDLPIAIPLPVNFYKFSFRIGFNLTFGCNRYKKLSRDKTLLNTTNWMF